MDSKNQQILGLKQESWRMFDTISKRYDLLNRVLSVGMDRDWRRQMINYLPAQQPGQLVLDLATGTADVLITLLEKDNNIRIGYGIDMSQEMLKIGQAKIEQKRLTSRAMLQKGDAHALNFMDGTFNVVTVAFGLRNMPALMKVLTEMHRVLKTKGRLLILEFSLPRNFILRAGHYVYLSGIVPLIGFLVSGNYPAYHYLNETIQRFPYGERFCKIIAQVGFKNVQAHPLLGGVATIYQADK